MRKVVVDGYILGIGNMGEEITKTEYNKILEAIKNKPVAPTGYNYKLKNSLEWELYKVEKTGGE